jgi:sortase (surface protein transpeptidase)
VVACPLVLLAGLLALAGPVHGASALSAVAPHWLAAQRQPTPTRSAAPASPAAERNPVGTDRTSDAQAIVAPATAPGRLVIPAIGVDAAVESVGLDRDGRMDTPSRPDRVAWYSLGSAPGEAGNAMIDGHLDWTDGPAVFSRLGRMRAGDEITVVGGGGSENRFVVDWTAATPYNSSIEYLFTRSGPPSLTLITCAGPWDARRSTYLQRLLVHASLVPPAPRETPGDEGG